MFQLIDEERQILKSQIVTSRWGGSRRANPYAFTEQGVAIARMGCAMDKADIVNLIYEAIDKYNSECIGA